MRLDQVEKPPFQERHSADEAASWSKAFRRKTPSRESQVITNLAPVSRKRRSDNLTGAGMIYHRGSVQLANQNLLADFVGTLRLGECNAS